MPKVSVLMPVYNCAEFLKDSIESILNQTFSDFDFIIINDGSTDSSESIIKEYARVDHRIKYFNNEKNIGVIHTLNFGLSKVSGEYLVRMDADDISLPDRIEKQVAFLDLNLEIGIVGSCFKCFGMLEDEVLMPLKHDEIKLRTLMGISPFAHPTVCMRNLIIKKYNLMYDDNFYHVEDYEFWTRLLDVTMGENLPDILLYYRVHEAQVSSLHNKIQQVNVGKVKSLVLEKLVSFDHKNYNKELVLEMLSPWCIQISCENLVKLKEFIADVVIENMNKKEYNQKLLEQFLRRLWLKYSFSAYNYNIKFLSIIFPGRLKRITRLSFKQSIKYIAKSIIGYRGHAIEIDVKS